MHTAFPTRFATLQSHRCRRTMIITSISVSNRERTLSSRFELVFYEYSKKRRKYSVFQDHLPILTTILWSAKMVNILDHVRYAHAYRRRISRSKNRRVNRRAYVTNNFSSTRTFAFRHDLAALRCRKCRSDPDKCILACYRGTGEGRAARSADPFVYRIFIQKLYRYARSRSPCHCSSSLQICQSGAFNQREAEETLFLERT